jgi:hypothetical protein
MKRRMNRMRDRDAGHGIGRRDFAVALATFRARPKAKASAPKTRAKLDTVEFAARLAREKTLQQRRYCNAFAMWRTCRDKNCRRQGTCCGDAAACLKRALGCVPHAVQARVRQAILDKSPQNIGTPERKARRCMPLELIASE